MMIKLHYLIYILTKWKPLYLQFLWKTMFYGKLSYCPGNKGIYYCSESESELYTGDMPKEIHSPAIVQCVMHEKEKLEWLSRELGESNLCFGDLHDVFLLDKVRDNRQNHCTTKSRSQ